MLPDSQYLFFHRESSASLISAGAKGNSAEQAMSFAEVFSSQDGLVTPEHGPIAPVPEKTETAGTANGENDHPADPDTGARNPASDALDAGDSDGQVAAKPGVVVEDNAGAADETGKGKRADLIGLTREPNFEAFPQARPLSSASTLPEKGLTRNFVEPSGAKRVLGSRDAGNQAHGEQVLPSPALARDDGAAQPLGSDRMVRADLAGRQPAVHSRDERINAAVSPEVHKTSTNTAVQPFRAENGPVEAAPVLPHSRQMPDVRESTRHLPDSSNQQPKGKQAAVSLKASEIPKDEPATIVGMTEKTKSNSTVALQRLPDQFRQTGASQPGAGAQTVAVPSGRVGTSVNESAKRVGTPASEPVGQVGTPVTEPAGRGSMAVAEPARRSETPVAESTGRDGIVTKVVNSSSEPHVRFGPAVGIGRSVKTEPEIAPVVPGLRLEQAKNLHGSTLTQFERSGGRSLTSTMSKASPSLPDKAQGNISKDPGGTTSPRPFDQLPTTGIAVDTTRSASPGRAVYGASHKDRTVSTVGIPTARSPSVAPTGEDTLMTGKRVLPKGEARVGFGMVSRADSLVAQADPKPVTPHAPSEGRGEPAVKSPSVGQPAKAAGPSRALFKHAPSIPQSEPVKQSTPTGLTADGKMELHPSAPPPKDSWPSVARTQIPRLPMRPDGKPNLSDVQGTRSFAPRLTGRASTADGLTDKTPGGGSETLAASGRQNVERALTDVPSTPRSEPAVKAGKTNVPPSASEPWRVAEGKGEPIPRPTGARLDVTSSKSDKKETSRGGGDARDAPSTSHIRSPANTSQYTQSRITPITGAQTAPVFSHPDKAVPAAKPWDEDWAKGDLSVSESRLAQGATSHPTASASSQVRANPVFVMTQVQQAMSAAKEGTIDVRLSPEELGRVRLQMTPTETGLSVHITAERPETLELMRRHIDVLQKDLEASGFAANDFSFGGDGKAGGGEHGGEGQGSHPVFKEEPAQDPARQIQQETVEPNGVSTVLDIRL